MIPVLKQVRRCDGACCRESPRFPNRDHSDCIYHDPSNGRGATGCMIMRGDVPIPTDGCIKYLALSIADIFKETCLKWPQSNSDPVPGDTGGCCWQFVS